MYYMSPIKIAVISDLHVGLAAKSKDMCPCPHKSKVDDLKTYEKKMENFKGTFLKFIEDKNITAEYLIIPGDITDRAHPEQARLASDFIQEAVAKLKVDKSNIIVVPGNHDVDWKMYDIEDDTGISWGLRYAALSSKKFIFTGHVENGRKNLFETPYFSSWNYENLFILGYNSSSHDNPTENNHRGLISTSHIAEIRKYLTSLGIAQDKVKIFVTHHHLTNLSLPIPDDPDFSIATNANEIIELLKEMKFDLIIHGHRHHPFFDDNLFRLPILCAGSFSAEIDTKWNGKIQNQFHLIEIDDRTNGHVQGYIKSWANTIGGWSPSNGTYTGIDHIVPFGSNLTDTEIKMHLFPLMVMELKQKKIISWNAIIEKFKECKYLTPKKIEYILSLFSTTEKTTCHRTDNGNYIVFRED